ncbi:MAG: hypothetical protein COW84_08015 [Gammaproteobacteria bacterium CG22_combo_CG10-13_8_21_14_all_40_8]|nr:MAG: hypothetical protein COW84_08015 [Gammaproteobacteria bacterium CG22_combo_CG10-13_8_21_14_all_40_8]
MDKLTKNITLMFLLLSMQMVCADSIDINKLIVPAFVKAQIVSDSMNMNGMEMGIIQFQTNRSFSDLLKYYQDEIGEVKVGEFENWKVISWIKNQKLNTVQVTYDKLKKITHGFIAVSDLPELVKNKVKVDLGHGFPTLKDSVFINDINATDLNKKSRTIWLSNHSSIKSNLDFYTQQYQHTGWILEQKSMGPHSDNGALMMRKGADELNLSLTQNSITKETYLFAVIVEK